MIEALRRGQMIVLMDDFDRENEGDLVCAAEFMTPQVVNFMLREARGVLCVAMDAENCDRLQLYPQAPHNTAPLGTAFTISVDAHPRFGITTGVSAYERATTIKLMADSSSKPADFCRPGHIFPLRARPGGVLERAGQTEGSVDLMNLAGLRPVASIIEVMAEDGTMARLPQLEEFCKKHNILICSIPQLIEYRLQKDTLIRRVQTMPVNTAYGPFDLIVYETIGDPLLHVALCAGGVGQMDGKIPHKHDEPVLVRMHSENMLADIFGIASGGSGAGTLAASLEAIQKAGKGALVYLRQESRGLALLSRIKELQGDKQPADDSAPVAAMDHRDFGIGAQILRDLGLCQLRLLTNRPRRYYGLEGFGLKVVDHVAVAEH